MPSSCSGRPICARSLEPNVLTTALQAASCVEAPDIDGDVGDPCWAEATTTNAFTPPGEATPAAKQVEARVAFDDTYLYLGFVCHEPEPLALQLRHRQDHPDVWTRPLVGWWRSNLATRITPVTRQLCPSGPRARCTTGIDGYGRLFLGEPNQLHGTTCAATAIARRQHGRNQTVSAPPDSSRPVNCWSKHSRCAKAPACRCWGMPFPCVPRR